MKSRTKLQSFKRLLIGGFLLLGLFIASFCHAGDLLRGYNFVDGQKVTAAQLNGLADNAAILPSFYTSKSSQTNLASTDLLLLYSVNSGAFRKITGAQLILNNTDWINSLPELLTPANNDFSPWYDVSAGALRKVSLTNVWQFTNQPLANAFQMFTLLQWDSSSGNYYQLPIDTMKANIGTNWGSFFVLTNLTQKTSLVSTDAFWVYDAANNVNKYVQYSDLLTNVTGLTTNASQKIAGVTTNGALTVLTNGFGIALTSSTLSLSNFASSPVAIPTSDVVLTNAHGLGCVPSLLRASIVCTTANLGYSVGEEVDLATVCVTGSDTVVADRSCDSTNTYLIVGGGANAWVIWDKSSVAGSKAAITKGSWNLKVYARP